MNQQCPHPLCLVPAKALTCSSQYHLHIEIYRYFNVSYIDFAVDRIVGQNTITRHTYLIYGLSYYI
jgi:hypothetical protein